MRNNETVFLMPSGMLAEGQTLKATMSKGNGSLGNETILGLARLGTNGPNVV